MPLLKQLFKPTNRDLLKRIGFTLVALAIFIIGTTIQVPGTESITKNLGFLELVNTMGGGALQNFSIFALGVMPYITATIVMQLLGELIPYFQELNKQGHVGRQKINTYSRYMGILFALLQGYAFSFMFLGRTASASEYLYISVVLTAGTAFLLWLGDQITRKGIGNGLSLIIMAGIIATLPQMFIDAFQGLVVFDGTAQEITLGVVKFILFAIIYFAIIVGVIFVQMAERKVPIQYANKSTTYGQSASYVPIKVNTAGVVPVIFASSLMAIPGIIAGLINNESFSLFVQNYLTYTTPVGFIIYVIFIFLFGFVYTYMVFKPEDFAKNLQESGGYIPGIRPGNETKTYLSKVLTRITCLGSVFLAIIVALPIIFSNVTSLPTSVSIGGTGLLIVVGVALETYKQIEGSLLSRNYKKGYSRR